MSDESDIIDHAGLLQQMQRRQNFLMEQIHKEKDKAPLLTDIRELTEKMEALRKTFLI